MTKDAQAAILRACARYIDKQSAAQMAQIDALQKRLDTLESRGVKYCGIWQRAMDYTRGEVVTQDGSASIVVAAETRTEPGKSSGWQLLHKGG